jgi:hypothetical protein
VVVGRLQGVRDPGGYVSIAKRHDRQPLTPSPHGTERKRVPKRRWLENRLAMLLAATYLAATARAMTALPHDELT